MVTKRFRVTGRVQGVGYRWSAQEEARRRGLAGWVANADDRSVVGLVQGDADEVEAFVRWLGQGPRGARVHRVDLSDAEPSRLRLFTIRSVVE